MPCISQRNYSATAIDNSLDSATSQSITFSNTSGRVSDELGKISIVGNGIPKVNSTTVTTYGDDGWVSGSDYEISIYCYKWAKLKVHKNGSLTTEDL